MSLFEAIVLGIIQGLTEFLPISSTAHLRVVPAFVGWHDPGAAFTAVIQIGTLIALLVYFRTDIYLLTVAFLRSLRDRSMASHEAKLAWMIIVGTVPIVVLGLLFQKQIKTTLRSLHVIAATAILLALVLWLAEWLVARRQKNQKPLRDVSELGWADALVVGLAQAVALIPGASRSGVTITGGLFLGMTRYAAARFSFLLALPSVFGAGIYELYKDWHELLASSQSTTNLAVATIVSGVVGYAAIAFLLDYLRKHSTYIFIVYRLALGALILLLLQTGKLPDQPESEGQHTFVPGAGYCLRDASNPLRSEEDSMDPQVLDRYSQGPDLLRHSIQGLTTAQLQAFPVPGTWSIQQIIVHVLESDLIASHRMKRIIAEDNPTLQAYDETRFAKTLFYEDEPLDEVLALFALNRAQTARILRRLPAETFARRGTHNERGELRLDQMVQDYVEHVDHHLKFVYRKRELLGNPQSARA